MSDPREKMLVASYLASDYQPWRCTECGEAVSHINPRPCKCIREAQKKDKEKDHGEG